MDKVSKEKRSEIMSRIRSQETKMELAVKPVLEALGFEYQPKGVYGKPDFAHRGAEIAVFLDGCFWHGCPEHYREPSSGVAFWRAKVERNRKRDAEVTTRLESEGWRVLRVWEHALGRLDEIKKLEGDRNGK